jgi:hypothetical protein
MILIENAVALMILGSLDAPLFEGTDMAIVRCTGFATIDVRLPALEYAGLAGCAAQISCPAARTLNCK